MTSQSLFSQAQECRSTGEECEKREPPPANPTCPLLFDFNLYGPGYVRLPKGSVSRSTQDLVSHIDPVVPSPVRTNQDHLVTAEASPEADLDPDPVAPSASPPNTAYTSCPAAAGWPQGGTVGSSGYFHLPADVSAEH